MRFAPRFLVAEHWGLLYFLTGVLFNVLSLNGLFLVVFWIVLPSFFAGYLNSIGQSGKAWIWPLLLFVSLVVLSWAVFLGRILLFRPFPTCRRQTCRGITEYRWNIATIFGREKWGVYSYKCQCGDAYVREGKRFLEILPDQSKRPYKKLVAFRKWADDPERSSCNGVVSE